MYLHICTYLHIPTYVYLPTCSYLHVPTYMYLPTCRYINLRLHQIIAYQKLSFVQAHWDHCAHYSSLLVVRFYLIFWLLHLMQFEGTWVVKASTVLKTRSVSEVRCTFGRGPASGTSYLQFEPRLSKFASSSILLRVI